MKLLRFLLLFSALVVTFSCMKEEVPEGPEPIEYVTISLSASLDTTNRDETKTYLYMDGKVGKVKWSEGDTILMYNIRSEKWYLCTPLQQSDITNSGCSANFAFSIPTTDTAVVYHFDNYIYYGKSGMPFSKSSDYTHYQASISVETVQEYVEGKGFDDFENIAFGYVPANQFNSGCVMHNVFGILKVNIQLSDFTSGSKIRSIRLTDRGRNYLAGSFTVTGLESGAPTMVHKEQTGGDSYTVEKRFSSGFTGGDVYFLVPPGSLTGSGFDIAIYTDSGLYGGKTVTGLSSKTIQSNHILPVKLSEFKKIDIPVQQQNTANTYIVPASAGIYSIPAEYPGNGYQGNGTSITPGYGQFVGVKAEIIWEGRLNGESIICGDIISNPVYIKGTDNNRYISFHRTGKEGCALVALKSSAGEVIWSWTLWITGDGTVPSVWLSKMNGTDKVNVVEIMDRNIGALNITNDNNSQSHGLAFQYGRKDAYMGARSQYYTGTVAYASFAAIAPATAIWCETSGMTPESHFSLEYSLKNPNIRLCSSTGSWCSDGVELWGTSDINSPKSLYDPCPVRLLS